MFITTIDAQTVLLDNFNRSDNNTVGNGWSETETSSPSSIAISSYRLKMGSTTEGRDWAYQDISSNYTTAGLSNNNMDSMVWAINFYQTRDNPSGFDKSNYGIAFVLGSTSSDYTNGYGYAVVLGQSGTTDPIRLVKFSEGMDKNSNLTNIISGGDYGNVYLSIKVTYKPSTNTWKLYAEYSSSAFPQSDPRNTSTLIGTGTDNEYTGASYDLKYLGCLWNHSTTASEYALFDDIYIPKSSVIGYSDIVAVASSEATYVPSNINTAGPLTSTQGTQVWKFKIRDGGASLNDADNLPTIVTGIKIMNDNSTNINWSTAIKSIDLFDGSTNVGSLQSGSANLTATYANFTGLNISVSDNTEKTITVRLTLNCPLGTGNDEGDYFRFNIKPTDVSTQSAVTSSQMANFSPVYSSNVSPRNEIQVIATRLLFTQQPTTTLINTSMTPNVIVSAVDLCGNIDLSYNGDISIESTGILDNEPITVTASNGQAIFSNLIHTETDTDIVLIATATGLTSDTSNTFNIYVVTQFEDGDFIVLSLCSNIASCQSGYSAGDDEISFMCFKNISTNDEFIITDNGYERLDTGKWGTSEGTYKIKRTGGTIPAGTVITIRLKNTSPYFEGVYPDNNWSMTNIGWPGTSVVLNSNGDQIYFLQGGTWDKGTASNAHDATYTPGHYLFAFNTNDSWTSFANSTQESGLVMGMECMNVMPAVATDFIIYTGSTDTASKIDWIRRVNNPANWTSFSDCIGYYADNRHYQESYGISTSASGTYVWTGEKNNNWFDCGNWQNLKVPDTLANVIIPSNGVTNEVIIPAPPTTPILYHAAYCRDITIDSTRTFTFSSSNSKLWVYRNMNINTSFSLTQGLVLFKGSENGTLSIDDDVTAKFYNVEIDKNTSSSNLFLADDNSSLIVKNQLTLTNGIINNQNNNSFVIIENSDPNAITLYGINNYIANKIKRKVNSTGSYDLPLGTTAYFELANINLNNAPDISYINANFNTPISPIDISGLGLYVDGTLLTELLDYGYWTIEQQGATTIDYDITITSRGHTNQGPFAAAHTIVKRDNSSTNWYLEGTHNNSDQAMGTDPNGTNWVKAKRTHLTAMSDFAIAKGTNPLPINLLYFDAYIENQQIKLKWATATEQNVSHFSIYRNNYTKNTQNAILNIPAFGNSNQLQEYIETDYNPVNGWNTYYLEETDYDGSQTLVATDAIYYNIDKGLEYNYDRSSQTLSIHINENCDNYKSFFIYSIDGKILYNYDITNINDISIPLNISSPVILKFIICYTTQQYLLVP
ncbi:MAG: hypothetical protein PWQ43_424 [Rikenellaceae bacterium]|nr:hypothetical protein [Rikenellaceae bacterium]MDN5355482.1 hypothetical protein [Rikenellaceae bacterium]